MPAFFSIFYLLGCHLVYLASAEKKGFILIAPSRFGSEEQVCVSLINSSSSEKLSVTLLEHKSDAIITSAHVDITGTYRCLILQIPQPTFAEFARLEVSISNTENTSVTKTSRTVCLLKEPWLMFVSTDKPIYGPSEEVRIRALIVTRHLKPITNKVVNLSVENPQGFKVFSKISSTSPEYLPFEASFKLVNDPSPGTWKVETLVEGQSTVRTFLVQKHVIPSFNVSIIAPRSMEENTRTEITVCAEYTFGKPVQGSVQVSMAVACAFEYYCKNDLEPFILNMTLDSKGCAREKLMAERTNGPYLQHVVFNASVKELGTGLVGEKSEKIILLPQGARSLIKGTFRNITNRIKPGLPLHGDLVLTTEDRNWESINVTLCRSFDNEKVCTDFETHDGIIPFTVPPMSPVDKVFIEAFWTNTNSKNSRSVIYLRPWVSPSSNYAQIMTPQSTHLKCDEEYKFTILHTFDVGQEFIVMMKSRGNIVMFQNASSLPNFNEGDYQWKSPKRLELGAATLDTPIRFISFNLKSLAQLSPEAALVVFTTNGQEVVADSILLRFQHCFPFTVDAAWNKDEAQPGDEVELSITTEPFSNCGVSGVDSRVHLLEKTASLNSRIFQQIAQKFPTVYPEDIAYDSDDCDKQKSGFDDQSNDRFLTRQPKSMFSDSLEAFESSGLLFISDLMLKSRRCLNLNEIEPRNSESANMSSLEKENEDEISNEVSFETPAISLRTEFPDVFLWSKFFTGINTTTIKVNLPGTITDWTTEVFCVSITKGLSVSKPVTIRSFKPFFVQFSLPSSVRRHERIHLSVSVFNYMNTSAPIMLTIAPSKHFHIRGNLKAAMCIPANEKLVHFFQIVSVKLGPATLAIKGEIDPHVAEECGPVLHHQQIDIVEQSTEVKAEGEPVEEIQTGVICGNDWRQPNQTGWSIKMSSAEYIPDSISCQVRVSGDLLGSAIKGIEDLIQKPTGCGEQTAMMLAMNLRIYNYLAVTGHKNLLWNIPDKDILKATVAMSLGYQKILNFRHPDGSFSAFGPESDPGGSIWLTAFLLPYLDEGIEVSSEAQRWVLNQQLENGCFPKIGEIYHWNNKRGDSPAAITAFIIISLLGSGISNNDKAIQNGLVCIKAPHQETDTYSEILATYAIALTGDKREASARMRKLMNEARRSYGTLWWEDSETETLESSIEMTSYAVLALMELNLTAAAADAVRWIVQFQNHNGGFISTQDTLMALKALEKFSTSLPESINGLNIMAQFTSAERTFEITKFNGKLLQTFEIPPFSTMIQFKAVGDGCAIVQTALKYNVRKTKHGKTLKIELKVDPLKTWETFLIEACVKAGPRINRTNMAILEINLPSGFYPDRSSLYQVAATQKGVKKFEEFEDHVNFYFDKLTSRKRCVSFLINSENCVENPAPFLAKVYDYYNSYYSSSVRQKIQQSCNESNTIDPLPNIIHLRNRRNTDQSGGLFSSYKDVSHDLETPNEIGNGFKLYAMPPTPGKDNEKCPRCLNETPSIFPKLYCSSQVAAQIRFRGKHLLDVLKNVSPQTNFTKIQRSVAFSIKQNCSCDLISPGSKVLMLVTPPRRFNLRSIQIFHIDDNITLIPWKHVVRFLEYISDFPNSCMDILTSD